MQYRDEVRLLIHFIMGQFIEFTVSSDAICFGPMQDIERASGLPVQPPPSPRPHKSGTVAHHALEHNVQAQNGKWHAYRLHSTKSPERVDAWFAAHELVDPLLELRKLVRVAGSPYEYDCGHKFNCDASRREGVLLVNRYDWDPYKEDEFATRGISEIIEHEGGDFMPNRNTVGLVDYAYSAAQVRNWAGRSSSQRRASKHGVWMHIPDSEYMWVRLGFNDGFTHARSFLSFTQRTSFFEARFPTELGPLRIYETELERVRRGLREGRDYSGIADLREMYSPPPPFEGSACNHPPGEADLLGPYTGDDQILTPGDIETLRDSIPPISAQVEELLRARGFDDATINRQSRENATGVFAASLREEIYDLMNELMLSFLKRFVVPLRSHSSSSTLGSALFPNSSQVSSFRRHHPDHYLLQSFMDTPTLSPALNIEDISARVEAFIRRQADGDTVAFSGECLTRIARFVAFVVMDLIRQADQMSFGRGSSEERRGEACIIAPRHVRMVIYTSGFSDILRYSRVLWQGRGAA